MVNTGLCAVALCLALATTAVAFDLCGPMYLDPNTFGGKQATHQPRSDFCTSTTVRAQGGWNDVNYVKGWRPLAHMEWFGALPKGNQVCREKSIVRDGVAVDSLIEVGIGVSINRNVDGGIRFNANSVGVYLDSKRSYWGKPETPTDGGLNQPFADKLTPAGDKSRGSGMWMLVNYESNQLWYAHPGMKAISFDLPASFKGKELYPHFQVWNSKSLEVLHAKPLMSYGCTNSLFFNKNSFGGYDGDRPASNYVTDTTLKVVSSRWNDVNYVKAGGVLMDGQWIGGMPGGGSQVGIGVSINPSKDGGIRFNPNSIGIYLDAKTIHWNKPEVQSGGFNTGFGNRLVSDPNGKPGMWIKVDYAAGVLWYAHPNMKPISFDLPAEFKNKPLFPHYQVWNGKNIRLETAEGPASVA